MLSAKEGDQETSASLQQLIARIGSLERDRNLYKDLLSLKMGEQETRDGQCHSPEQDDQQSESGESITTLPPNEITFGATSLFEPLQVLNHAVSRDEWATMNSQVQNGSTSSTAPTRWQVLRHSVTENVRHLALETRTNNVAKLHQEVDVYFTYLNPHYPSLNENQFRSQLANFLNGTDGNTSSADHQQFTALVNLMQAEVRILTDEHPSLQQVPGWDEFCRAESLLHRLIWLGKGNILTIQCLLIKAKYLLYMERSGSAYHVMGQIVHLCFQLGLHNQSLWKDCTPFQIAMRQRIFWSIFYLERSISLNSGLPYLIRESDFKVDVLPSFDDKLMTPDQPLPGESPKRSYGPYMTNAVKWGKLGSEIWDLMFGISAEKPTSQEYIATMDARIHFLASQMPSHLQWKKRLSTQASVWEESEPSPPYIFRQAIILHLVSPVVSIRTRLD